MQATTAQRQQHRGSGPRGRGARETTAGRHGDGRCVQDDDDDGRLRQRTSSRDGRGRPGVMGAQEQDTAPLPSAPAPG